MSVPGTLYLVATPIGNLEDITLRALRILREVALIACEDTRHSRKLMAHYGIATPLTACHQHNEESRAGSFVDRLLGGESIALISDAGTPGISDPGYRLVGACHAAGVPVTAIPGPSAVVSALAISGLPTDAFFFAGFLPPRSGERRRQLRRHLHAESTTVYYEAPHRLLATLRDLVAELGSERQIAVARELTKIHEELCRGSAAEVLCHFEASGVRGEIVLLIAPSTGEVPAEAPAETVQAGLQRCLAAGMKPKAAAKEVARLHDLPSDTVYAELLALRAKE